MLTRKFFSVLNEEGKDLVVGTDISFYDIADVVTCGEHPVVLYKDGYPQVFHVTVFKDAKNRLCMLTQELINIKVGLDPKARLNMKREAM